MLSKLHWLEEHSTSTHHRCWGSGYRKKASVNSWRSRDCGSKVPPAGRCKLKSHFQLRGWCRCWRIQCSRHLSGKERCRRYCACKKFERKQQMEIYWHSYPLIKNLFTTRLWATHDFLLEFFDNKLYFVLEFISLQIIINDPFMHKLIVRISSSPQVKIQYKIQFRPLKKMISLL